MSVSKLRKESEDGVSSRNKAVPSPRPQRGGARTAATRVRLLKAGRKLFGDQGPRAVTTHDIAAEAGYASGTFYLHFKDKHALFRELAEETASALEDRMAAASANKTEVEDIVYAQADTLVGFAEEQRDLIRILFHPDGEAGDVPDRILERLAAGVSARRKERAAIGQSSACFDTEVLAQAVVGMWARVLVWWAEDPSRATRDDLVRTLTHFHLHGSGGQFMDICGQSSCGND